MIQRKTFQEVNDLIEKDKIDVAFLCSGAYIEIANGKRSVLPIVPQVKGQAKYRSYIIVRTDSGITNFADLRKRSFAFLDPLSFVGKTYPTYLIKKMGLTPDTFFSKYIFTQSNDDSIRAVREGIVDGAGVDSLVFEYLALRKHQQVKNVKVILKSPPFAAPPVVIRTTLDSELQNQLREIFLTMHKNREGKKILSGLRIDKFVISKEDAYSPIKKMKFFINSQ